MRCTLTSADLVFFSHHLHFRPLFSRPCDWPWFRKCDPSLSLLCAPCYRVRKLQCSEYPRHGYRIALVSPQFGTEPAFTSCAWLNFPVAPTAGFFLYLFFFLFYCPPPLFFLFFFFFFLFYFCFCVTVCFIFFLFFCLWSTLRSQ